MGLHERWQTQSDAEVRKIVNQKGSNDKGKSVNEAEVPLFVQNLRSLDQANFQPEAVEILQASHLPPAFIQNAQPSNFVHPDNLEPESVPANPVTPVAKVSTRGARKTQGQNK